MSCGGQCGDCRDLKPCPGSSGCPYCGESSVAQWARGAGQKNQCPRCRRLMVATPQFKWRRATPVEKITYRQQREAFDAKVARGMGLYDPRRFGQTWPEPGPNVHRAYIPGFTGLGLWDPRRFGQPWPEPSANPNQSYTPGFSGLGGSALEEAQWRHMQQEIERNRQRLDSMVSGVLIVGPEMPTIFNVLRDSRREVTLDQYVRRFDQVYAVMALRGTKFAVRLKDALDAGLPVDPTSPGARVLIERAMSPAAAQERAAASASRSESDRSNYAAYNQFLAKTSLPNLLSESAGDLYDQGKQALDNIAGPAKAVGVLLLLFGGYALYRRVSGR